MESLAIIKQSPIIKFNVFNFAKFSSFYFEATENEQTVFTLPSTPVSIILLAINGIAQNENDFTVVDRTLTLANGVDADDLVYGVMQI